MTIARLQMIIIALFTFYCLATLSLYLSGKKEWLEKYDRKISRILAFMLLIATILRFVLERETGV